MKGCVLVVAPDEGFRAGITARLRQDGYRVVDAADQAEAMGLLDHERVDVVVWHCAQNDGWGWILLDHVRGLPGAPPVILLVPKGQVQHGIEGMRRGAFDDLLVPFAWESLQEKVAAAMRSAPKAAKKKKTLRQRWEDFMVAAAFAEAGASDEARRLIKGSGSNTAEATRSEKKRGKGEGKG
ncbi:MAG: response regulator [Desulfosoma sp.]